MKKQQYEYAAAHEGRIGADRMAAGLPIIPDELAGDLEEIKRLRLALTTCGNLADWILEHTTGGDGTIVAARKIKRHAAMPNDPN
jgi:hypothetical protein